jgi:hypothetical protein
VLFPSFDVRSPGTPTLNSVHNLHYIISPLPGLTTAVFNHRVLSLATEKNTCGRVTLQPMRRAKRVYGACSCLGCRTLAWVINGLCKQGGVTYVLLLAHDADRPRGVKATDIDYLALLCHDPRHNFQILLMSIYIYLYYTCMCSIHLLYTVLPSYSARHIDTQIVQQ